MATFALNLTLKMEMGPNVSTPVPFIKRFQTSYTAPRKIARHSLKIHIEKVEYSAQKITLVYKDSYTVVSGI